MGGLAVLAALAVLGIPVAVIYLLVSHSGLKAQVRELEKRVARLASAPDRAVAPVPAAPPEERLPDAEAAAPLTPTLPVGDEAAAAAPAGPWQRGATLEGAAPRSPPVTVWEPKGPTSAERLMRWLSANWVYAVSAVSLALAGIFFVQYGIENGLLSPAMRVLMALGFGAALIIAGEVIRRRWGDDEGAATAYLPSTFSGAGLVSMFGGIVAARMMYGLIGPEAALAGLVAVALGAIVLGWMHGPFLAAVGLIGATAAPFLVGGSSEVVWWLYAYFALVALIGLGVDTLRRWAWVSVLALGLGFGAGWLLYLSAGDAPSFMLMLAAMVVIAIAIPARGLWPDHAGPSLSDAVRTGRAEDRPGFPSLLAAGSTATAIASIVLMRQADAGGTLMAFVLLGALAILLVLWTVRAPAIWDLAALPAAGFVVRLVTEVLDGGPLAREIASQALSLRPAETGAPGTFSLILALATAGSLAAVWRSFGGGPRKDVWAAGAALFAPLTALLLELFWQPANVLGAYAWALHAVGLAALMAVLAERFARADGEDRRRAAYAVLSCLSLIALALFLILTKGALTVALAVLVVVAALLDRRFRLPELGWYIQAGVAVIGYRLTIDPGLDWAFDAPLIEVALSFVAAIAGLAATLWVLKAMDRKGAQIFAESGLAAASALFVNVLLVRWIDARFGGDTPVSHWSLALNALPWIIVMAVQLYRESLGGWMVWVRRGIAAVAGMIGLGGLLAAAGPANPLFGFLGQWGEVKGPLIADTLLVAYALPGLVLLGLFLRLDHLPKLLRLAFAVIGAAFCALYVGLEIRRFWQGDDLSVPGVSQPELYSYTVAMLVVGAGLLYQAIARRSSMLRRVAMGVIALTIAKVFLIDASGLSGLTRVFSFLALGLSLAALAWLNRWAAARADEDNG